MAQASTQSPPSATLPFKEIPGMGVIDTIRSVMALTGARVDMRSTLDKLYDEKGPIVRQRGGPVTMVNLFGPDANCFVLLDQQRIFSSREPWMMIMGEIFPNGLLLRDGEEHKRDRRIMQGAFRMAVLQDYAARMNPMIARGTQGWANGGSSRLAFHAYKGLTLDIAASIFLGADLGSGTAEMNKAFEDMVSASMSRIKLRIPGLEFNRGVKGREYMLNWLKERIGDRRAEQSPDLFSRLCHAKSDEGDVFDNTQIFDHLVFLMMAAHDTTTSTLTSMTYELAKNPEWQERAREESLALGVEQPEMADLEKLPSLTMVMKETLRRYPPLPIIPRTAQTDFEFGGYQIPAGTMVVISPIHTHHMEEWWPDPFKFDPERFSPERKEDEKHTHSWVPFGGGPHLCLGFRFAETQIRLIMHQLLLRYRWTVPEDYQMPVQQAPISKPRDGLPVVFTQLG